MKNKKTLTVLGMLVLVCIFLTTCFNPIIFDWWDEYDVQRSVSSGENFCIVVFDSNGGDPKPKAIKVNYGNVVGRLLPMTRKDFGFIENEWGFKGWFDERGRFWDVEKQPVTKNDVNSDGILLLTAEWVFNDPNAVFKVEFITDYPSVYTIADQYIANGGRAVQPIISVPNPLPVPQQGFNGWYFNGQLWDFNRPVTEDMTLHAGWLPSYVIVRFEPHGGKRPDGVTELEHQFSIAKDYGIVPDPGPLIKEGPVSIGRDAYLFDGWYTDDITFLDKWDFNTRKIDPSLPNGTIITLYAKWTPQFRNIIFDANNGNGIFTEQIKSVGASITNPGGPPPKPGYTFLGWFFDPSCISGTGADFTRYTVPAPFIAAEDDPIFFYAKWMPSQLYVTFNIQPKPPLIARPEDKTGKVDDLIVVYNGLVQRPNIKIADDRYLDNRWYTDAALTNLWNFETNHVTANLDLYAEFDDTGWTVSFYLGNPSGGTSGFTPPPDQHVLTGGKVIEPFMPPLPARPSGVNETRWSFLRWDYLPSDINAIDPSAINRNDLEEWKFDSMTVSGNMVLYARWVPPVPDMVWVPRGSFIMGDSGITGSTAAYHAFPTRRVTVDGFYISRYEITQEDGSPLTQTGTGYNQIMGTAPSQFTGTRTRPVENVSWHDAVAYCDARSGKDFLIPPTYNNTTMTWSGDGYRLPTEAEWEYAARGGYYWNINNFTYSGSNIAADIAWFNTTVKDRPIGFQTTQTVGTKAPNQLGIYDMSGNLSEWCYDWFAPYSSLIGSGPNGTGPNPIGAATGTEKVRRGGAWNNAIGNIRVAVRNSEVPTAAHWAVGFRIVRGPSEIY